ncbi:hypothetical protein F5887DRAFT_263283 [Amanita rubescens]|nr:hypothetical protein F5887DRAFT_263283 [Amanita rubescens]
MQPLRPLPVAGDTQNHVQPSMPLSSHPHSGSIPSHSQTLLPSIRQLHPYLPPAGMPHSPGPMGIVEGPSRLSPTRGDTSGYGVHESEADELEQQGPPKKKRRRQALSCTECKRRKIKCDRSQPCAPCTRRGEQAKCHWHVVEPVEKYVTRQEFDELKARFDDLAALVARHIPHHSPSRQMGHDHALPAIPGPTVPDAVQPYHSGYLPHQSIPPPIQSYHSGSMSSSPQALQPPTIQRSVKAENPHLRSPISAHVTGAVSPPYLRSRSPLPSSLRHRVTDSAFDNTTATTATSGHNRGSIDAGRSTRTLPTTSPTVKNPLPPSLASITSPYIIPEPQPKNCHAQMLKPGERLRNITVSLKDLAVIPLARLDIHAFLPLPVFLLPRTIAALLGAAVREIVTGLDLQEGPHPLTLTTPH